MSSMNYFHGIYSIVFMEYIDEMYIQSPAETCPNLRLGVKKNSRHEAL